MRHNHKEMHLQINAESECLNEEENWEKRPWRACHSKHFFFQMNLILCNAKQLRGKHL